MQFSDTCLYFCIETSMFFKRFCCCRTTKRTWGSWLHRPSWTNSSTSRRWWRLQRWPGKSKENKPISWPKTNGKLMMIQSLQNKNFAYNTTYTKMPIILKTCEKWKASKITNKNFKDYVKNPRFQREQLCKPDVTWKLDY